MNLHGKDIKIFSANANPAVAEHIAKVLGLPMGKCDVSHFSDGEISVSIHESGARIRRICGAVYQYAGQRQPDGTADYDGRVQTRLCRPDYRRYPVFWGMRGQDRKAKARDPISAKLVADLITTAGADRVLTMDLHAAQIQGFFNIPVDHLLGVPILAPYFEERFKDQNDVVVVSPDLGSVTRARKFAERMNAPLAIIDKRRPKANVSEVMNIIGDVKGKRAVIVDDLVDTAGTLCNGAKAIIEVGGATEVYACATHGVLSGPAIERIEQSVIKELVLLDTIALPEEKKIPKITMVPVGPVFAEAIERIYADKPVSPLFV